MYAKKPYPGPSCNDNSMTMTVLAVRNNRNDEAIRNLAKISHGQIKFVYSMIDPCEFWYFNLDNNSSLSVIVLDKKLQPYTS